ncbi:hypothetical protein MKW94_016744, partial [Papaver nudicaule]|nr:hypothetical protein [Papaver nudicaule]
MALYISVKFQCFLLLIWLQLASRAEIAITASTVITKHGCQDHCGNVSIPYPFGIGHGCYISEYFEIKCDDSLIGSTKPRRGGYNISSISILDGEMTTEVFVARNCPERKTPRVKSKATLGKFTFSSTKNKFIGIGCNTWAYLGLDSNASSGTGCLSVCNKNEDATDGSCGGVGCCKTSIPSGIKSFKIGVGSMFNDNTSLSFNPCGYGFLVEERSFNFSSSYLKNFKNNGTGSVPVVVDWTVGNETCGEAKRNLMSYACGPNTDCISADNTTGALGYRCSCAAGYSGNPYLNSSTGGGCQDIDECKEVCMGPNGNCRNTEGSYECSCNKGYQSEVRNNFLDCYPESLQKQHKFNKIVL